MCYVESEICHLYSNHFVMVEHHQKQILGVGCYVEIAIRKTQMGKDDMEVDFMYMLNFVECCRVWLGFLVGA